MSGRKKNRRHQNGQPPHDLLRELSSLRELLGSDMEADIPLLDQVANSSRDQHATSSQQHGSSQRAPNFAPGYPPKQPQRPLTELDLPILFSPIDEEPLDDFDDYVSELSEADRELLRPLQDLPRSSQSVQAKSDTPPQQQPAEIPREEFQPQLFEPEQIEMEQETGKPAAPIHSEPAPVHAEAKPIAAKAQPAAPKTTPSSSKVSTVPMTENPFLPPHIRARLTGGKVPRPEPIPAIVQTPQPPPQTRPEAALSSNRKLTDDERERLLEQLVAEQLPELERQLRLSITMMLDELYPKKY